MASTLNVINGTSSKDTLIGTDASDSINGLAGNDTLEGGKGDDILNGGTGNDKLSGGAGANTYLFDDKWGNDTITLSGALDTVDLSKIHSSVHATMWNTSAHEVSDGTNTIDWIGVVKNIKTGLGNDVVYGDNGDNTIETGGGNDTVDGGRGNDTIIGGKGNDVLSGGYNDDTYIFSKGEGHDIVDEYGQYGIGGTDTIRFDKSVSQKDVVFFENFEGLINNNGDPVDLKVGLADTQDGMIVTNQLPYAPAIEKFELADGSYLTDVDVNLVIQSMASYAVSHGIAFNNITDVENNANLMSIVNSAWHH